MIRFLLGFVTASVLWGLSLGLLYASDRLALRMGSDEAESELTATEDREPSASDPKRRRRPRRTVRPARGKKPGEATDVRGSHSTSDAKVARGESTTGDDIGWDDARQVSMTGGEEQLSGGEIEAGFDRVMGRIRRCLVLVPAEGQVTGKLTFGMRVGADGVPRAVSLTGPSVVTTGESGSCLQKAAQAIRFESFDGPDMVFRYPITLR